MTLAVAGTGNGGEGIGPLFSTSWTAPSTPPNQGPARPSTASGSVRPRPVSRVMPYTVGAPNSRVAATLAPSAGFRNGSSKVSASAMVTPPMPRLAVGKIRN